MFLTILTNLKPTIEISRLSCAAVVQQQDTETESISSLSLSLSPLMKCMLIAEPIQSEAAAADKLFIVIFARWKKKVARRLAAADWGSSTFTRVENRCQSVFSGE